MAAPQPHSQTEYRSAPHPDDSASRRRVTVNMAENPLSWLHSRGLLTDRQVAAGGQLHADFIRAGLNASVTMRWDAPPPDGSPRSARSADHGTIGRMDAKRRFDAAMDAVGAGLADICWRVICAGEGMAGAERAMGWPSRSGRIILTLALDRLADFYRLPSERL
jgi:hypothetical protein